MEGNTQHSPNHAVRESPQEGISSATTLNRPLALMIMRPAASVPNSGPSSPLPRRRLPRPAAAATSWREAPRSSRSTGSAPAWLPANRPAPPAARRDCCPRLRPPSVSLVRAVRAVRAPSSSESAVGARREI